MKKLLLFLLLLLINDVKAQTSAQLDINNINATVNTINKPLFHDGVNTFAGFEAPKGSGRHSIFASNLWIGGKDINDSLHLAISSWGFDHDFIPGPIMDSIQYVSQIPIWNRVWKVDRYDILNHINFYNQPGYSIPQVFLDWPAHGNTSIGQAANLAPYFDYNNNGIYDPTNGDYPLVPGDQCIYFIFNDDTIHTESGGEKMKIEVHAFVYSFNCPSDSALMNTVFVKYKIINRSMNDYNNTSIGIWTDLDNGCYVDDYIGSNVQNGSYYSYNADTYDDWYSGVKGYGDSLTSQSVTFLGGPIQDDDGLDNPFTTNVQNAIDSLGIPYEGLGLNYQNGINDDERIGLTYSLYMNNINNFPPIAYYQIMHGLNGTNQITYDQTGIPCRYMYPGISDPLFWGTYGISVSPWTENSSGNTPGDRRALGSINDFTFESGSTKEIDLAYVFARDYQILNDPQAPVAIMNSRIDDIRNYFIAQQTPCYTFYTYVDVNEINENISFDIFPNPASQQFTLNYSGKENNLVFSVHDILGKEIFSGKIISTQTNIDCSNWSKGVYLVKVGNENGYGVKKIVVE